LINSSLSDKLLEKADNIYPNIFEIFESRIQNSGEKQTTMQVFVIAAFILDSGS